MSDPEKTVPAPKRHAVTEHGKTLQEFDSYEAADAWLRTHDPNTLMGKGWALVALE